jgi:hypothetical protein
MRTGTFVKEPIRANYALFSFFVISLYDVLMLKLILNVSFFHAMKVRKSFITMLGL